MRKALQALKEIRLSIASPSVISIFFVCLFFLISFRAVYAFRIGINNDDACYVARVAQLVGFDSYQICAKTNYFAPGASILWIPAGILARLLGLFGETKPLTWAIPLLAIFSYSLWGVALYFLIKGGQRWNPPQAGRAWKTALFSLCLLLNVPFLNIAVAWPLTAHTAQLALSMGVVYFSLEKKWSRALLFSTALFFTRYNDLLAFLLPIGGILDTGQGRRILAGVSRRWLGAAAVVGIGVCYWTFRLVFQHEYGGLDLFGDVLKTFNAYYLGAFLFSDRWGMLWMCPLWVVAFVLGLVRFHRMSWMERGAWLWILVEGVICASWRDLGGGGFGYRYLIGSFGGVVVIIAPYLSGAAKRVQTIMRTGIVTGALWLTYLTFIYRSIEPLKPEEKEFAAHFGEFVVRRVLGVPRFFESAIRHLFDWEVYRNMADLQVPYMNLFISLFRDTDPSLKRFVFYGPALVVLTVAIMVSSIVVALYLLRMFKRFIEKSARHS